MLPDQKLNNLILIVERLTLEFTQHKHQIVRIMERQDKMERQFALLSQIQGELASQATDEDDLEMEPGVAVWTPEGIDDD